MPRPGTFHGPEPAGSRVLSLDSRRASRSALVGSKAAALAVARSAGLPVEPGVVLTTVGVVEWRNDPTVRNELERAWKILSDDGRHPVIVRSSSTIEDTEHSSMAGVFRSILDVGDRDGLLAAVDEVISHAAARSDAPLAVLVQPMVDATFGGVLFGADPVTGRSDRVVVAVVHGGPDVLVRGAEQGARYVLTRGGRVIDADDPIKEVGRRERRTLTALARRTALLFGAPQDVEWAFDRSGEIRLLQSRPISTLGVAPRGRPHYGPGPVAETFPSRLSTLESDLWVPPLDEGVTHALATVGAAPSSRSRGSGYQMQSVFALDGWVVAHLDALAPPPTGARRFLDPRVGMRRLRSAWSTGRLRAVLPERAASVLATTDEQLAAVPPLDDLDDRALVTLLDRSRALLRALHGHEVLCGVALREGATATATGAGAALAELERGRQAGLDDDTIVAAHPVVLALVPPRIGASVVLPPTRGRHLPANGSPSGSTTTPPRDRQAKRDRQGKREGSDVPLAAAREQLRLRARWVHELTARAAFELGRRLELSGHLPDAHAIRDVSLDELRHAVDEGRAPAMRPLGLTVGSVPSRFVLDDNGRPIAVMARRKRGDATDGQGAGGGRATGVVVHRDDARPGTVLVVSTLDPDLAPLMPGLAAVVAETGSVLSHLAILAREYGVATVVGVPDAVRRWPPGVRVEVDGVAGTVTSVDTQETLVLSDRPEVDA